MVLDFLLNPEHSWVWLVAAGALLVMGWLIGRATAGGRRRPQDPLGTIMAATVLRRSRRETLGHLLEAVVRVVRAESAVAYLVDPRTSQLDAAYVIGVDHFDEVAHVPITDPLVQALAAHKQDVLQVEVDNPSLRWAALANGKARALAALKIGAPRGLAVEQFLLIGWRRKRDAQDAAGLLHDIGRYARQVLAGFDETEQRARDVQALSAGIQQLEVLSRTTAHDVLNKVTASLGSLDLAASDSPDVERARAQIALAGEMLEDLRDPDRPISPEAVRVEELVELSAGLMAVYQEDQAVDFRLDIAPGLPDVWVERVEILRVLDNILTNAVRHNGDRSPLRVWMRVRREGVAVLFEIGDDGKGFDPAGRETLFEFGVSTDTTGRARAHGMGLWSCKRIIGAHGGRIWAESEPGQGARFYFTLPTTQSTRPA